MTAPTDSGLSDLAASPERIVDVELTDEMQNSFLEYAYSVIYSRALPDARDGLKPVQRRIIYQMSQMGLTPEKGHVKSARVVGDVMGKLHPHGDSAIYDALVRLAQPFSLRVPLVDGHGNFGSLDDGPAAARYTEARLRPEAMALVRDLDEDVVDFVPNYDNQLLQPSVLPAAIPNLLVNGASGIAVGMATNIPPHNLGEVVSALELLSGKPDCSLEELLTVLPGPDLPTGGTIIGSDGLRDAYSGGRGAFKMRATVSIENVGPRKTGLVVTELPYLVGPERVIEKIKDAVSSKKLAGISDVTDLTDRHHGLRLVIGIKSGFDPEAVLTELYRLTPLEESFSVNSVALVEGQPRVLSLKDMLSVFLDHRLEVVTRRSRHRLEHRQKRLHLVDGLLIAITDIDRVIEIIRSSEDSHEAKANLQEAFSLSEDQVEYILELRLRRLTKFSALELHTEQEALRAEIEHLTSLLEDEGRIRSTVIQELKEAATAFDTPRRTIIAGFEPPPTRVKAPAVDLQVSDMPCEVVISADLRARRIASTGAEETSPGSAEVLRARFSSHLKGRIGVITEAGVLHAFSPMDLPEVSGGAGDVGVDLRGFIGAPAAEGAIVGVCDMEADTTILLATRRGVVKRVELKDLPTKSELPVITIKDDDQLVAAAPCRESDHIVMITDGAQLLHFPATAVRPQGPQATGMAGISLASGQRVLWTSAHEPSGPEVVTVSGSSEMLPGTEAHRVKRTKLADFPAKGRATQGVRCHSLLKGEDSLLVAYVGMHPIALSARGDEVALPGDLAKRDASGTLSPQPISYFGERID